MEYPQHFKAKTVLSNILKDEGYVCLEEQDLPRVMTALGDRDYTADILAFLDGRIFVFEIDGRKGHSSKRDLVKMRLRDSALWDKFKIKTVRIPTQDLVGRHPQPLSIILKEIDWQLKRYDPPLRLQTTK